MDILAKVVAEALFLKKDHFRRWQKNYIQDFRRARVATRSVPPLVEEFRFFMHRKDPMELVVVYIEGFEGGDGMFHLVFSDEEFAVARVDEKYRELRQERYGRTMDVETIAIKQGFTVFPQDFAGIQPYNTSIHMSSVTLMRTVFSSTWNHLFHFTWKPWESLKDYREVAPPLLRGTREDAESR